MAYKELFLLQLDMGHYMLKSVPVAILAGALLTL